VTVFLLVCVFVLVLVNGFFVAAEFALVRARRGQIEAMARTGARGARLALHQIDHIDEYLAACQLGITMASLAIGFLGEPAIAQLLEEPLGNVLSHGVAVAISIAIAYLIVTTAHITVGEQVPKIHAITHAEVMVRLCAAPLQWFRILSRPLVWALNSASNAMLRLIGTDARADFHGSSGEDVRLLIAESATGGSLDTGEARMLSGVFQLHEQKARHVMTPFVSVVTARGDEDVETVLRRCVSSGHTRLPIVDAKSPDRVIGITHTNALAELLIRNGRTMSVTQAMRRSFVIPETRALDDLLEDLQREQLTMAVVVDEYGHTAGIVTVEDIVEEIVGEIADETDPTLRPVRRLAGGDWYARGDVSLSDLADHGILLQAGGADIGSVAGLVLDLLGRIPTRGETVTTNGFVIKVESVRANRINAVRITTAEPD
jgi:CBS domain containing-hemolysin-like protein